MYSDPSGQFVALGVSFGSLGSSLMSVGAGAAVGAAAAAIISYAQSYPVTYTTVAGGALTGATFGYSPLAAGIGVAGGIGLSSLLSTPDDVLAYGPWWLFDPLSDNILGLSSPIQIIRNYSQPINQQSLVPPELLASVLLAEMRHYNMSDSLFDGRGGLSIGIAQIRVDTVRRHINARPDLYPPNITDKQIEARLWNPLSAISVLAMELNFYAKTNGMNLSNWRNLPETIKRQYVSQFTSAKDDIFDKLGNRTYFGEYWGVSSYEIIRSQRLLD